MVQQQSTKKTIRVQTTKKSTKFRNRKSKKINCSPIVEGRTVDKHTCYTNSILIEIKDAFNNQPENKNDTVKQINTSNPTEILAQLRLRMANTCDKEKCWLKLLNSQQQQVVNELVFSPEKPPEWEKNPNEWLSNFDILNVLKQYEKSNPDFKFIGPTPIDFDSISSYGDGKCVWEELCHFSLKKYVDANFKKIGIIFNLDKHDQSGSHWVSLFIDIKNAFIFYFDSASNKTPFEIKTFVQKIQKQSMEIGDRNGYKYYENYPNNHQKSNTECGMYSLYFIITMINNKKSANYKIKLFKEKKIPDKFMKKLRNVYFNDK
jgi:hypothetical protein